MASKKSKATAEVTVEERDGKLVVNDPLAYAIAVHLACTDLYRSDEAAVARLEARAVEKSTDQPFVVVVIDMDDEVWQPMGDTLMPGADWNKYRKAGEKPVARGVVPRALMYQFFEDCHVLSPDELRVLPNRFTAVFTSGGVAFFDGGKSLTQVGRDVGRDVGAR